MYEGLLIRAATPADAEIVVTITQAAYRQQLAQTSLYEYVFQETPAALAQELLNPLLVILLLEKDGEPVASVRLGLRNTHEMHLWRLGVLPDHQGKGYSKILVDMIERWAAAWGRHWVRIGALEASPDNRAMYERWGYEAYGRKEMGSAPGNFYTLLRKPTAKPSIQTVEVYETIADDYAQRHNSSRAWMDEALTAFEHAMPAPATILEIGSGTGHDAELLTKRGYRVIAMDRTAAFLQIAKQRHPTLLQGDARSLPVADQSVDAVWAQASLLHVSRLEITPALLDIRRVLRPNGVLYVSLKMGDGERTNASRAPDDQRLFAFYQPDEVTRLLHGAGFEIVHQSIGADHRGANLPHWVRTVARAKEQRAENKEQS